MLLARNHEVIASAFMQYQSCADSTPEADCIQLFRKYTLSRMMLAADFAWQTEIVVGPTIFLFAYKEVRNLWFSIITCGLHSRKTTVSRENAAQNGKKNIIPLIVVTQSATTEMWSTYEALIVDDIEWYLFTTLSVLDCRCNSIAVSYLHTLLWLSLAVVSAKTLYI